MIITRIADAYDHANRDVAECCQNNECSRAKTRLHELRKLIKYLTKSDNDNKEYV